MQKCRTTVVGRKTMGLCKIKYFLIRSRVSMWYFMITNGIYKPNKNFRLIYDNQIHSVLLNTIFNCQKNWVHLHYH